MKIPATRASGPDLAGVAIVPDVLLQSHSAPLEMVFYTATNGVAAFPAEYHGDIFAAFHGSWNRSARTGYKVVRVRLTTAFPPANTTISSPGLWWTTAASGAGRWAWPWRTMARCLVTEDGNGTLWRVSYAGAFRIFPAG